MNLASFFRGFVLIGCAVLSCAAGEFRGRLEPKPKPRTLLHANLMLAGAEVRASLPTGSDAQSELWVLRRPFRIKGTEFMHAVAIAPDGGAALWLDRDRDGKLTAPERWALPTADPGLSLTLPWDNGIYREFPLQISFVPASGGARPQPPALVYSFNVLYEAGIDVDGKELRFTFAPFPEDSVVKLGDSRITCDTNFNGKIESELGETENASGKSPVFRVGRRYLAVKSVDMATGEVVVEERPATDYTRFDALPGQEMPDFAFTTFDGAKHKLSDFRGRYVLLDFWGTWCGPCISEMKHLDPLYEKYHPRGFEVIGMNMEKTSGRLTPEQYAADAEKVRAFLAKAGHKWLQATQESIERVAIDVIHVNSYPTCILIGPDGKVVSREARSRTLERLLAEAFPDAATP